MRQLCEAMENEYDSAKLIKLGDELIAAVDASVKPVALVLPSVEKEKPIAQPTDKLRIAVVDDNDLVRRLMCEALRSHYDFEIVCEARDGADAIECAEELQPDVVVLDVSLRDMNGIEVVRWMREIAPDAQILLCSQHELIGVVKKGLKAGAPGYLLKSDATPELAIAVRKIRSGEQYVSNNLAADF